MEKNNSNNLHETACGLVIKEDGTIVGHVFIIPNELGSKLSNHWWENNPPVCEEEWRKFKNRQHKNLVNVPEDDYYVQIWCLTPNTENHGSNWNDHYEMVMPENREDPEAEGECFPKYLPVSLFKDKKEGDSITIQTKWGRVELTLNQLNYRYRRFGRFEDVLKKLLEHIKDQDEELKKEFGLETVVEH